MGICKAPSILRMVNLAVQGTAHASHPIMLESRCHQTCNLAMVQYLTYQRGLRKSVYRLYTLAAPLRGVCFQSSKFEPSASLLDDVADLALVYR